MLALTTDGKKDGEDLLAFVRRFADQDTFTVEEELGHGYVRLKITEAERRQALQDIRCVEDVVKELVRNARDAGAAHIYVAFQKEKGRWRNVTVLDDGRGIPESMHRRIFEARVTSKVRDVVEDFFGVHGRGMALFSIKQVADDIQLVRSTENCGTIMYSRMDNTTLPEKKDQSSFPKLELDENGNTIITGGPHNVPRVLAEFALSSHDLKIYMGSNAEILATLYHHSLELRKAWAAGDNESSRPLWFDLGGIKEGRQVHGFCAREMGLNVSERNAFRILEFEIHPLMSINELLGGENGHISAKRSDLHRQPHAAWSDHLARRLSQEDISLICTSLQDTFADIGRRYYLQAENPVVKRRKNRLIISLGLHESENE
jgi:anti-sigma regulatory factor (Ser/Thr protein kinase)